MSETTCCLVCENNINSPHRYDHNGERRDLSKLQGALSIPLLPSLYDDGGEKEKEKESDKPHGNGGKIQTRRSSVFASIKGGAGVYGWSYGGYLTLMCLAKVSKAPSVPFEMGILSVLFNK